MKTIAVRKAAGRKLTCMYDCTRGWEAIEVNTQVPGDDKLFNFIVEGEKHRLFVLDPYGNEIILGDFAQRIFDRHTAKYGYTIAVDGITGDVGTCMFQNEPDGSLSLAWSRVMTTGTQDVSTVPKRYRERLPELLHMKRPFQLSIRDTSLVNFIEREEGFQALRENLTITLRFDGDMNLELWGDTWREVSDWKRGDEPKDRRAKRSV